MQAQSNVSKQALAFRKGTSKPQQQHITLSAYGREPPRQVVCSPTRALTLMNESKEQVRIAWSFPQRLAFCQSPAVFVLPALLAQHESATAGVGDGC